MDELCRNQRSWIIARLGTIFYAASRQRRDTIARFRIKSSSSEMALPGSEASIRAAFPNLKAITTGSSIVKSYRAIEPWLVTYCEKHCLTTGPRHRGICGHVGCDSCDCCWDDPADRIQREPCL